VSSVLEFFLEFLSRSLHQRHNQLILSDLVDCSLTMAEQSSAGGGGGSQVKTIS
jgi:hypothetical protein